MNIDSLKNIDGKLILVFSLICALFLPGLAIMFYFFRDLFIEVDFFKLTVLSILVYVPFWIFPALCVVVNLALHDVNEENTKIALGLTLVSASIITFITIFIFYLIGNEVHRTFVKWQIAEGLILSIGAIVIAVRKGIKGNKR